MKAVKKDLEKGLTMVEVVIASAIILGTVLTLLGVHTLYLNVALGNAHSVKAAFLLEETLEVVRYLRDDSYSAKVSTLSNSTNYGVVLNGTMWQASTTSTSIDNFQRYFTLSPVSRDANRDIVSSGGTLDPNTKLVTASVSWAKNGATTTKSISTYITNLYQN